MAALSYQSWEEASLAGVSLGTPANVVKPAASTGGWSFSALSEMA